MPRPRRVEQPRLYPETVNRFFQAEAEEMKGPLRIMSGPCFFEAVQAD
jgi:hypothetical protein